MVAASRPVLGQRQFLYRYYTLCRDEPMSLPVYCAWMMAIWVISLLGALIFHCGNRLGTADRQLAIDGRSASVMFISSEVAQQLEYVDY